MTDVVALEIRSTFVGADEYQKAAASMQTLSTSADIATGSVAALGATSVDTSVIASSLDKIFAAQSGAAKDLSIDVSNLDTDTSTLSQTLQFFGDSSDSATDKLNKQAGSVANLNKGYNSIRDSVANVVSGLNQSALAANTISITKAIDALGLGFVGVSIVADSFSNTVSKLDAKIQELHLEGIKAGLEQIHQQFSGSMADQAAGLFNVLKAGADNTNDALAQLTAANKLALASLQPIPDAASAIGAALAVYGEDDITAATASDLLAVAMQGIKKSFDESKDSANKAAPTLADLAKNLEDAGTAARPAGVSLQELLAATMSLTEGSTSSADAMERVSSIIATMQSPSGDARTALAKLNIELDSSTLQTKHFSGALESLAPLANAHKDVLHKLFNNTKDYEFALKLIGPQAEGFKTALTGLNDVANATDNAISKNANSVMQANSAFVSSFQDLQDEIGVVFLPLVNAMTAATTGTANFIKTHHDLALAIGGTLAVIAAVAAPVLIVSTAFSALAAITTGLAAAFGVLEVAATTTGAVVHHTSLLSAAAVGGLAFALYELIKAHEKVTPTAGKMADAVTGTSTALGTATTSADTHTVTITANSQALATNQAWLSSLQNSIESFASAQNESTDSGKKSQEALDDLVEKYNVLQQTGYKLGAWLFESKQAIDAHGLAATTAAARFSSLNFSMLAAAGTVLSFSGLVKNSVDAASYYLTSLTGFINSNNTIITEGATQNSLYAESYTPLQLALIKTGGAYSDLSDFIFRGGATVVSYAALFASSYLGINQALTGNKIATTAAIQANVALANTSRETTSAYYTLAIAATAATGAFISHLSGVSTLALGYIWATKAITGISYALGSYGSALLELNPYVLAGTIATLGLGSAYYELTRQTKDTPKALHVVNEALDDVVGASDKVQESVKDLTTAQTALLVTLGLVGAAAVTAATPLGPVIAGYIGWEAAIASLGTAIATVESGILHWGASLAGFGAELDGITVATSAVRTATANLATETLAASAAVSETTGVMQTAATAAAQTSAAIDTLAESIAAGETGVSSLASGLETLSITSTTVSPAVTELSGAVEETAAAFSTVKDSANALSPLVMDANSNILALANSTNDAVVQSNLFAASYLQNIPVLGKLSTEASITSQEFGSIGTAIAKATGPATKLGAQLSLLDQDLAAVSTASTGVKVAVEGLTDVAKNGVAGVSALGIALGAISKPAESATQAIDDNSAATSVLEQALNFLITPAKGASEEVENFAVAVGLSATASNGAITPMSALSAAITNNAEKIGDAALDSSKLASANINTAKATTILTNSIQSVTPAATTAKSSVNVVTTAVTELGSAAANTTNSISKAVTAATTLKQSITDTTPLIQENANVWSFLKYELASYESYTFGLLGDIVNLGSSLDRLGKHYQSLADANTGAALNTKNTTKATEEDTEAKKDLAKAVREVTVALDSQIYALEINSIQLDKDTKIQKAHATAIENDSKASAALVAITKDAGLALATELEIKARSIEVAKTDAELAQKQLDIDEGKLYRIQALLALTDATTKSGKAKIASYQDEITKLTQSIEIDKEKAQSAAALVDQAIIATAAAEVASKSYGDQSASIDQLRAAYSAAHSQSAQFTQQATAVNAASKQATGYTLEWADASHKQVAATQQATTSTQASTEATQQHEVATIELANSQKDLEQARNRVTTTTQTAKEAETSYQQAQEKTKAASETSANAIAVHDAAMQKLAAAQTNYVKLEDIIDNRTRELTASELAAADVKGELKRAGESLSIATLSEQNAQESKSQSLVEANKKHEAAVKALSAAQQNYSAIQENVAKKTEQGTAGTQSGTKATQQATTANSEAKKSAIDLAQARLNEVKALAQLLDADQDLIQKRKFEADETANLTGLVKKENDTKVTVLKDLAEEAKARGDVTKAKRLENEATRASVEALKAEVVGKQQEVQAALASLAALKQEQADKLAANIQLTESDKQTLIAAQDNVRSKQDDAAASQEALRHAQALAEANLTQASAAKEAAVATEDLSNSIEDAGSIYQFFIGQVNKAIDELGTFSEEAGKAASAAVFSTDNWSDAQHKLSELARSAQAFTANKDDIDLTSKIQALQAAIQKTTGQMEYFKLYSLTTGTEIGKAFGGVVNSIKQVTLAFQQQALAQAKLDLVSQQMAEKLKGLDDGLKNGTVGMASYTQQVQGLATQYAYLGDQRLQPLNDALKQAIDSTQQLEQSASGALESALQAADQVLGTNTKVQQEELAYAKTKADLDKQLAEAQKAQDSAAIASLMQALELQSQVHNKKLQQIQIEAATAADAASKQQTSNADTAQSFAQIGDAKAAVCDCAVNPSKTNTSQAKVKSANLPVKDAGKSSPSVAQPADSTPIESSVIQANPSLAASVPKTLASRLQDQVTRVFRVDFNIGGGRTVPLYGDEDHAGALEQMLNLLAQGKMTAQGI